MLRCRHLGRLSAVLGSALGVSLIAACLLMDQASPEHDLIPGEVPEETPGVYPETHPSSEDDSEDQRAIKIAPDKVDDDPELPERVIPDPDQVAQCPAQTRRSLIQTTCQKSERRRSRSLAKDYVHGFTRLLQNRRAEPHIAAVIVNAERRFLFCRVNKAGVLAAKDFFKSLNPLQKLKQFRSLADYLEARERSDPRADGFVMVNEVPVEAAVREFADYKKMLVVRHPLQRFVSSFYQVVVMEMNDGIGIDGFADFIERRVLNHSWMNIHWLSFHESCFPCEVNYDFILRMEMLDEEFPQFNEAMGFGKEAQYPHNHPNPNFNETSSNAIRSLYKYDNMLADLEQSDPKLFQALLDEVSIDMDLFSYTWQDHASGCYNHAADCC